MTVSWKGRDTEEYNEGPGLIIADIGNNTCPDVFKRPYDAVCTFQPL